MGLGISLSGLANGYNNFQKGQEDADNQAQLVKDRAYQDGVRADDVEARGRAKQMRADIANIPTSVTTETPQSLPPQDDGSDPTLPPIKTTRAATMDEQLRSAAAAHKRAGDMEGYATHTAAADKIGFDRSAKTASEVIAASDKQSAFQIATAARAAFDADPYPGKISKIKDNGDGGVNVTAINKDTGQETTRTYANAAAMRDGILSHYSPAAYAALQNSRLAEAAKIREEQAKVHSLGPGGQLANGLGVVLANNQNMTAADAKLAGLEFGIGGRAGGVGKAIDQNKLLDEAWDRSNTGDAKLPPDQLMTGRRLTEQLVTNSGGKVKPALAAEIAYNVTKDPKLVQPAINNATGDIEGVYKHPTLGDVKIDDLPITARSPGDYKPEQMKSMANAFVGKLPPGDRTALVGAAFDQSKTTALMTDMYAAIDKAAEKRRQDNPNITEAQNANWAAQTKRDTQSSIQKKLDLISLHADRPKANSTAKPDAKTGGVTPPAESSKVPEIGLGSGTVPADKIPPPPPKNLPSSAISAGKINPDYTAWQERYGAAQTQQNELRASQDAARSLAAKKSYNPYAQNSVK